MKRYAEDLSKEERQFLRNLNDKLTDIEKKARNEVLDIVRRLRERVQDKDDWISDFEIECKVEFYLNSDDPEYKEDEDNILAELQESLKHIEDRQFSIADGRNHNEWQYDEGHPMYDEYHCYLYHCLYDHTRLTWDDILRIGMIWVDIEVIYQHCCDIK